MYYEVTKKIEMHWSSALSVKVKCLVTFTHRGSLQWLWLRSMFLFLVMCSVRAECPVGLRVWNRLLAHAEELRVEGNKHLM